MTELSDLAKELVYPFIESTKLVLSTMLHSECIPGEINAVREGHHMHQVSSVIGLSGDLMGSICFSTTNEGAKAILERMAGLEADSIDEFVRDAVGEMANMIAGYGKRELDKYQLRLGLPQVIVGQDLRVYSPRWSHHFWLPLTTDIGPCTLDMGFGNRPS